MLTIYRFLLYLYPRAYRDEYGEEMMAVFREVRGEINNKGLPVQIAFGAREAGGLLRGAWRERVRRIAGASPRSLTMRSEFKFPRATVTLMLIIFGGVIVAIDRGRAVQSSVPYVNPSVGPIQPAQFTTLRAFSLAFAAACIVAAIGWAILFALHQSGVQRFSEVELSKRAGLLNGYSMVSSRKLSMPSAFKFSKGTITLMAITLGGITVAIDQARGIQAPVPYANPQVGPIQPAGFSVLPAFLLTLMAACIAGAIGWALLFAMHRSGVQRFAKVDPSDGRRSGTKLSV